jgi:hypothetical protein
MTGPLVLASDATQPLNPVSLQQLTAMTGYRNRIINGDMSVDQRNGGVQFSAGGGGYVIDRWMFSSDTAAVGNIGQSAVASPPAGFPYLYAFNYTTTTAHATVAAGDYTQIYQQIEGINFNDARWGTANAQPITLEFWAAGTVAGTYTFALGGANPYRSYVGTFTLPAGGVWTKIKVNIPGDIAGTWAVAANAAAFAIQFNLAVGSTYQTSTVNQWIAGNFISTAGAVNVTGAVNRSLSITGVALMVGAAASNAEPEFKKYSDNLIDCQRYFEKSYDYTDPPGTGNAHGAVYALYTLPSAVQGYGSFNVRFKTTKRAQPTFICYSPASGSPGAIYDVSNAVDVAATGGSNGMNGWYGYGLASLPQAQLQFSMQWAADADF